MKVKDIMTPHPVCCYLVTTLKEVAQMMKACDCEEIPVIENINNLKPVGVITDYDIVCHTIALGKNPLEMTAGECMRKSHSTVNPEAAVEECYGIFKEEGVSQIPVVDQQGRCCGVVSEIDFAAHHYFKDEICEAFVV